MKKLMLATALCTLVLGCNDTETIPSKPEVVKTAPKNFSVEGELLEGTDKQGRAFSNVVWWRRTNDMDMAVFVRCYANPDGSWDPLNNTTMGIAFFNATTDRGVKMDDVWVEVAGNKSWDQYFYDKPGLKVNLSPSAGNIIETKFGFIAAISLSEGDRYKAYMNLAMGDAVFEPGFIQSAAAKGLEVSETSKEDLHAMLLEAPHWIRTVEISYRTAEGIVGKDTVFIDDRVLTLLNDCGYGIYDI